MNLIAAVAGAVIAFPLSGLAPAVELSASQPMRGLGPITCEVGAYSITPGESSIAGVAVSNISGKEIMPMCGGGSGRGGSDGGGGGIVDIKNPPVCRPVPIPGSAGSRVAVICN